MIKTIVCPLCNGVVNPDIESHAIVEGITTGHQYPAHVRCAKEYEND